MKNNIFFNFSIAQKKRVKKNFFSLFSNLSSKLLLQIMYPPLMLLFWGVDNFGIWLFITAIPSTLTMFNINFTQAAKIQMSINDSQNNRKLVNIIFNNGFGLIIINMIIFTIIYTSAFFLIDLDFKIFENINIHELKIILTLIILSFYFTIFESILVTGITYRGKLNIATNVKTLFELLSKVSIITCGVVSNSLIYAAIIFLLVSMLQTSILYYYYLENRKYLFLSIKLIRLKELSFLFKLSLSFYAEAITNIAKHNGLIVLLGIFFTSEIVGLVSTVKTLFYFLMLKFINVIVHTSIYEYSIGYGKKQVKQLKYNYKRYIFYIFLILSIFTFVSLIIGPKIYNFWTNDKYELNYFLLLLVVLDSVFYNLRDSICVIIKSVNKFLRPAIIETFLTIFSILISYYYLSIGFNLISVLLINVTATFISFIFFTYFSLKFYYKLNN